MNAYFHSITESNKTVGGVCIFKQWTSKQTSLMTTISHTDATSSLHINKEWSVYSKLLANYRNSFFYSLIFHVENPENVFYLTNNLMMTPHIDHKNNRIIILCKRKFKGAKPVCRHGYSAPLYIYARNANYNLVMGCLLVMQGKLGMPKLFKDLREKCRFELYTT